jgi:phosphatidylethanolamine/phosphatidyl-N-methylethanolamine N-methyltransferase
MIFRQHIASVDAASVVAAYSRWAPVYNGSFGVVTRSSRMTAMELVNRIPPSRVLEAGVGTGISLPGYDWRHRVVGIDLSPAMLERARRLVEKEALGNVEDLRLMDLAELDFPDASFDVVMAMFVMTVVPDPHKALVEIARVLRPGGYFVVTNHFKADEGPRAMLEKAMAPLAPLLGWRPDFPMDAVMGQPGLRLVEIRRCGLFGFFQLLVFQRD